MKIKKWAKITQVCCLNINETDRNGMQWDLVAKACVGILDFFFLFWS